VATVQGKIVGSTRTGNEDFAEFGDGGDCTNGLVRLCNADHPRARAGGGMRGGRSTGAFGLVAGFVAGMRSGVVCRRGCIAIGTMPALPWSIHFAWRSGYLFTWRAGYLLTWRAGYLLTWRALEPPGGWWASKSCPEASVTLACTRPCPPAETQLT